MANSPMLWVEVKEGVDLVVVVVILPIPNRDRLFVGDSQLRLEGMKLENRWDAIVSVDEDLLVDFVMP